MCNRGGVPRGHCVLGEDVKVSGGDVNPSGGEAGGN
jgi:hypothetical protein